MSSVFIPDCLTLVLLGSARSAGLNDSLSLEVTTLLCTRVIVKSGRLIISVHVNTSKCL